MLFFDWSSHVMSLHLRPPEANPGRDLSGARFATVAKFLAQECSRVIKITRFGGEDSTGFDVGSMFLDQN